MIDILDLETYPLDQPDSTRYIALVERCRADLDAEGMFNLTGLVRPSALQIAVAQLQPVMDRQSFTHRRQHNIYFRSRIDGLPESHPALRRFETINHTICADQMDGSDVLKIYAFEPLIRFLAETMGKDRLWLMDDPLARVNVMAYHHGEALNWHFDRSEFTTTLLLQAPEQGGDFEYRTGLRSDDDPNYAGVADLLNGSDPQKKGLEALCWNAECVPWPQHGAPRHPGRRRKGKNDCRFLLLRAPRRDVHGRGADRFLRAGRMTAVAVAPARRPEIQDRQSMDQRQFLASLTADQRRKLQDKSDGRGLAHLAVHAGAIVLVAGLILMRVPFWPVLMLPLGILIIFLFTLLHESIHRTAFASGWINDTVARCCGFMIVLPSDWFRFFHFAHHRHTQDPEKDPELATAKPETILQYVVHVSGLPVWYGHLRTLIRNASGRCDDAFVPASGRDKVTMEARVMLASYALVAGVAVAAGSAQLLYVWVIPILLGQPFLRLYLLAEHGRCPFVANMFENSRTTFTNRMVRRLTWNMPYHAEHHAVPTVPFHRLPDLHELTRPHLHVTENGYARFHGKYVSGLAGENTEKGRRT